MPATHLLPENEPRIFLVRKNGADKPAHIMQRRPGEVYVHYLNTDKRMDEWVKESDCRLQTATPPPPALAPPAAGSSSSSAPAGRKARGGRASARASHATGAGAGVGMDVDMLPAGALPEPLVPPHPTAENGAGAERIVSEEDYDVQHHKQLTAQRNFDMVIFDSWKIKPWYFSPYPLMEAEEEEFDTGANIGSKIPGVSRATARSHGRTSDLLAGGLLRSNHAGGSTLWVCHFCFKYMSDGVPWELHKNNCKMKSPPGRKVYQRGAHMIWEVDGAKEKLYCQNLSLFGKLFIDVKTLFFDCDNFLFYILTDAQSKEDHILGFFSKEKLSYDDYNLACIMTLPQYQRKGYGMLLIEFSYELSRRANKVGTPERPLSDLGLRSYLSFWISTLLRFFRRVLTIMPPDVKSLRSAGNLPSLEDATEQVDVDRAQMRRAKRIKGFDGEIGETGVEQMARMMPLKDIHNPKFTSKRTFETFARDDGGVETHIEVRCTLEDIAAATNLRIEDAAFALNECGLLMKRIQHAEALEAGNSHSHSHSNSGYSSGTGNGYGGGNGNGGGGGGLSHARGHTRTPSRSLEVEVEMGGGRDTILITRALVDKVAEERNLKRMYMDPNGVML